MDERKRRKTPPRCTQKRSRLPGSTPSDGPMGTSAPTRNRSNFILKSGCPVCRPYAQRQQIPAWQSQAQNGNRTGFNFPLSQPPVGRQEFRWPLRFCAPEFFCLAKGITPSTGSGADSPCQGEMSRSDRGGRVGDYEHKVLIWSRPRRRFGYFAAAGKVTRRPQAAKSPLQETKPLCHRPLIRHGFAVPPSPRGGKAFWGSPLIRPLRGHLPPKGKA